MPPVLFPPTIVWRPTACACWPLRDQVLTNLLSPGNPALLATGVLYALMTQPAYRELAESLRLNADAQVLLISTEGDTSPDVYEDIVWFGRNG